jgi:hypothetical protein
MGVLLAIPLIFGIAVVYILINMVSGGDKGQTPQSFDRGHDHPDKSSTKETKGLLTYKTRIVH